MVQFVANVPHRSKTPEVVVENAFEPGRYRFRLVVFDDGGNDSAPVELTVTVLEPVRPVRPDIIREEPILRRPVPLDRIRLIRPQ